MQKLYRFRKKVILFIIILKLYQTIKYYIKDYLSLNKET
jgi:hypothetical protein